MYIVQLSRVLTYVSFPRPLLEALWKVFIPFITVVAIISKGHKMNCVPVVKQNYFLTYQSVESKCSESLKVLMSHENITDRDKLINQEAICERN